MASNYLTLVSLFFLASVKVVLASPCLASDINFNLLVFGLNGKDYNASTQDSWGSSTAAADITTTGRPPFDAANTTCYLSQFYNAVYVMNGDSANPNDIYIFDAATKAWSAQTTTSSSFVFAGSQAILDHDTNVFYAVSNNELFFLNMQAEVTANSSAIAWMDVEKVPFTTANTVMALAQNHVHFLNVPSDAAGDAQIFVIHFSFFQPTAQSYPVNGGGTIPATTGHATSFFQPTGVQQEFAFIPSDSSAVYVINVETNTTQKLAGPTVQDPAATYFASETALVQLSSSGEVSFLPYTEGQDSTNAAAAWSEVKNIAAAAPPSSSGSGSGSSASGGSGSGTATSKGSGSTAKGSGTATGSGAGSSSTSGALGSSSRAAGLFVASAALIVGASLL